MERSGFTQDRVYGNKIKKPKIKKPRKTLKYTVSSGNIFRDMELDDADELLQRSDLRLAKLKEAKKVDKKFIKEHYVYEKEIDKAYDLYFAFISYLKKKYWSYKKVSCGADVTIGVNSKGKKTRKVKLKYTTVKMFDESKLFGKEAIRFARNFIKKNPSIITIPCCDDGHGSSVLLLVPHINKEYHGFRMIFIPEKLFDGDKYPSHTIFIKPGHLDGLINGLLALKVKRDSRSKT